MPLRKIGMAVGIVQRHPKQSDIARLKLMIAISQITGFARTNWRRVLGIEIQHQPASPIICQAMPHLLRVKQVENRRNPPDFWRQTPAAPAQTQNNQSPQNKQKQQYFQQGKPTSELKFAPFLWRNRAALFHRQSHIAPVAQWIEHPPPKGRATRSIRVGGTS